MDWRRDYWRKNDCFHSTYCQRHRSGYSCSSILLHDGQFKVCFILYTISLLPSFHAHGIYKLTLLFYLHIRSHHNRQMFAIIHAAGHRIVFRAPYYPVDGPIEYVFNTIQGILQVRMDRITDGDSLVQEMNVAIAAIPSFEPYFINCGFIHN